MIRRGDTSELAALREIMRQAILHGCADDYGVDVTKRWAIDDDHFTCKIDPDCFVWETSGKPVAVSCWRVEETDEKLARVSGLFALPEAMGKGIGKQLLERVDQDIRENGFKHAILFATKTAQKLYQNAGWVTVEPVEILVATKTPITIFKMEKLFD